MAGDRRLDESQALWSRARSVIPCGTQTMSKGPSQFVQGVSPIYLRRGRGARVWDVDGNEYLDYPMALGPVILGYCDKRVDAAIRAQLDDGITFTLMHPLEVEVAEQIVRMVPGVEAVRFGKSGSDALSAAVRAARALTGRDSVAVAGYHGWHDWFIGSTLRRRGVPAAVGALAEPVPFNDLDMMGAAIRERADTLAAVIVEPAGAELPAPGYLQAVIDLAHAAGALVIFDEVITGFRLAPGGARERYGVQPDLSCYGKALGNGMPISAVAGPWSVMGVFEDVFFSGTHNGEALSLAAAAAVLDVLADGTVLRSIESKGTRLLKGMQEAVKARDLASLVSVTGEPQRAVVGFPDDDSMIVKSWVQQCFLEGSILFNGSMFISEAHDDADIDRTLEVFDGTLQGLETRGREVGRLLKGPPIQPVFRAP